MSQFSEIRELIFQHWPAKVLSLAAAVLLYVFVTLFGMVEYEIVVPINYQLPENMVQGSEYKRRVSLIFRAEKRIIDDLKGRNFTASDFLVKAEINKIGKEGRYRAPLQISLLSGGQELSQFGFERAEPSSVEGTLEPAFEKEVMLLPAFTGQLSNGSELGDFSVIPETIRIQGPRGRLDAIGSLETEAVNLDNQDQTFVSKVRLKPTDPLIRVLDTEVVSVRVNVRSAVEITVFNNISIEPFGLAPTLKLSTNLGLGSLRTQQSRPTSTDEPLPPPRMLVDLSSITTPGTYSVLVFPLVASNIDVIEVLPGTKEVIIEASNESETNPGVSVP